MRIVACIKQVPAVSEVGVDSGRGTLLREKVPGMINPLDRHALAAALFWAEKTGGTVTALSMGPPRAAEILREALAMGAHAAVLLSDTAFAGADTWATARTLAAAIAKISGVDLVICGKQAIDGDTGQVPPGIAEHLSFAQATYVRKIKKVCGKEIVVERSLDDGYEVISLPLPAVAAVERTAGEPKLPTLKRMLATRGEEIPVWRAADLDVPVHLLGAKGSPTRVKKAYSPAARSKVEMIKGKSTADSCCLLADKLCQENLL